MFLNTIQSATLLSGIKDVNAALLTLLNSCNDDELAYKPDSQSWNLAEITEHVMLSTNSVIRALALKGTKSQRDPAEKIQELESMFLDFTQSYQAPDFILPTNKNYKRAQLINEFAATEKSLMQLLYEVDFEEMIEHPAFGNISKLEIAHFVWYHTQRHLRQMKIRLNQLTKEKQLQNSIELFKTNVTTRTEADKIINRLKLHYPSSKITIDLNDCDKILRIEGEKIQLQHILTTLKMFGFRGSVFT